MFHLSFPRTHVFRIPIAARKSLACLAAVTLITTTNVLAADLIRISSLNSQETDASYQVMLVTDGEPSFTSYKLFNPPRIVIDIAEAGFAENFTPTLQIPGATVKTETLSDMTPQLARIEISLDQEHDFKSEQLGNQIVLNITKSSAEAPPAAETAPLRTINQVKVSSTRNQTKIVITGNAELGDYTYDVLDKDGTNPPRLFIDLNNATGDDLLQEQLVNSPSLAQIRVAKRGSGLRFVLDAVNNELFPFTINAVDNSIEIVIDETGKPDEVASLINQQTSIESQLPEVDPLDKQLSPQAEEKQIQDAFNFSGYNKQRITVDFYKIDLHNVFRIFREVSGINIIVDEEVSGSLTLALDNVPWDFALDVILNLKDLQKEERFNTLVILPKDKEYAWAAGANSNITFETDVEVVETEALTIRQQQSVSKEIIKAKQFMSEAKGAEKREDFETAVHLYEKALELWPDNSKLANRISSLYLVHLRQNAKAVFFGQKALEADNKNVAAALNTAIASANMQEVDRAIEYFDQAISVEKPSQEALLSYAAFIEAHGDPQNALKLYQKQDELYGQNLNSMVATARIFDNIGDHKGATEKYKAILLSGVRVPPDLAKYIKGRLALNQSM
ncbi:AMIN domain-containing protein [Desulfogranum japonicum]|uniref:AMIN domain-containing protein n=1 Tax=Desulfogranum japonicum TaxID=231447 RepID=UPI00048F4FC4|nr:AMIN domain-containing protein [Desulfogranum japonicum]